MKYLTASAAVLGLSLAAAAPTHAQVNAANLVNVNLSDIRLILVDVLDVNDNQIPATVQVPVGVAANVCPELDANVIAQQKKSGSGEQISCTASSTSQALNQIVKRNLVG